MKIIITTLTTIFIIFGISACASDKQNSTNFHLSIPTLSAVGSAKISSQPGRTDAQKRLMAIRDARMAAIIELAEQIHRIQVDSNTTVIDLMVENDTFRAVVKGVVRGAKTVRINPTGDDTYETVLEIDKDMMSMMLRQAEDIAKVDKKN